MGWFGKGIMDGDAPLDWLGVFMHIIGAHEDASYDKPDAKIRSAIETRQQLLAERVRKECDKQERNIGWHVLGVLIMAQGAKMSNDVHFAVRLALEEDEWAKAELERKIYVREMIEILDGYDGHTPTREYKDWAKEYGLNDDDIANTVRSWKVLNIAMCAVAEHLRSKPWFKGVHFAVNRSGYRMLLLVDEKSIRDGAGKVLNDADVPGELFNIPVSFYVLNQNTVMNNNDKIHD